MRSASRGSASSNSARMYSLTTPIASARPSSWAQRQAFAQLLGAKRTVGSAALSASPIATSTLRRFVRAAPDIATPAQIAQQVS